MVKLSEESIANTKLNKGYKPLKDWDKITMPLARAILFDILASTL